MLEVDLLGHGHEYVQFFRRPVARDVVAAHLHRQNLREGGEARAPRRFPFRAGSGAEPVLDGFVGGEFFEARVEGDHRSNRVFVVFVVFVVSVSLGLLPLQIALSFDLTQVGRRRNRNL